MWRVCARNSTQPPVFHFRSAGVSLLRSALLLLCSLLCRPTRELFRVARRSAVSACAMLHGGASIGHARLQSALRELVTSLIQFAIVNRGSIY
jgi:hypothetical protein